MRDPDDDGRRQFFRGWKGKLAKWLRNPRTLQLSLFVGRVIVELIRHFWN